MVRSIRPCGGRSCWTVASPCGGSPPGPAAAWPAAWPGPSARPERGAAPYPAAAWPELGTSPRPCGGAPAWLDRCVAALSGGGARERPPGPAAPPCGVRPGGGAAAWPGREEAACPGGGGLPLCGGWAARRCGAASRPRGGLARPCSGGGTGSRRCGGFARPCSGGRPCGGLAPWPGSGGGTAPRCAAAPPGWGGRGTPGRPCGGTRRVRASRGSSPFITLTLLIGGGMGFLP
ncbi:hypothetical protein APR08_004219 [Nocardia amikacinitolerans]|nr:hypothetical protein [Nocardia amikacinitolerans]